MTDASRTAPPPRSLAVCVPTFLRPEGLDRFLRGLARTELPHPAPDVAVVVVDNDAGGSAAPLCERARDWLPFELHYRVEKRRGIAQARNTALAVALPLAEWVVMTDDDVEPTPGWLAELARVQAEYDADVVAGPNPPRFLEDPPGWIVAGGFFEPARRATGSALTTAATHNAMVRSALLAQLDSWFDESLGLRGGEDTELFLRIAALGHRMVWADEAIVYECVPPSRATLRWLLQRAYRIANGMGGARSRALRGLSRGDVVAEALRCTARGVLRCASTERASRAQGLWLIASGAGWLTGLLGFAYREYRTHHGR